MRFRVRAIRNRHRAGLDSRRLTGGRHRGPVTLLNPATGVETTADSDAAGNFEFFNVRIGRYLVRSEKTGFAGTRSAEFQVVVGARQRVDLEMKVGTRASPSPNAFGSPTVPSPPRARRVTCSLA